MTIKPDLNVATHCSYRFPSGRHCRQSVADSESGLCFRHVLKHRKSGDLSDIISTLGKTPEDFLTASGINRSLSELYVLLAQNRISSRRASVLAYINNLLLRTLPAIEHENNPDSDKFVLIVDGPRPIRNSPAEPVPGDHDPQPVPPSPFTGPLS